MGARVVADPRSHARARHARRLRAAAVLFALTCVAAGVVLIAAALAVACYLALTRPLTLRLLAGGAALLVAGGALDLYARRP